MPPADGTLGTGNWEQQQLLAASSCLPLADGRVLLLRVARCCHQPLGAPARSASAQFPVLSSTQWNVVLADQTHRHSERGAGGGGR